MVHTTAGYMVYAAYTFKNVFNYEENDIFWCTADIGWITGHSYILYGPLLNGATTVIFEGVPSYPDFTVLGNNRKAQSYTVLHCTYGNSCLSKTEYVQKYTLASLKVIGSVGEPINEEAWHWYNDHVGAKRCPLVDTWWQTETGGILISPIAFVTPTKPTYASRRVLVHRKCRSAPSASGRMRIEIGAVAGDQAGLLQRPYPAQAGRRRQADAVGQVLIADAPISLQDGKDLPVVAIDLHNISP